MWNGRRINKFRHYSNRKIEEESDAGVGRARETVGKKSHISECKSTAAWRTGRNENCDKPAFIDRRIGNPVIPRTVDDLQVRGEST